jgi:hypothetical protein
MAPGAGNRIRTNAKGGERGGNGAECPPGDRPGKAVRGAVRHFQACGSLDMDALATELAISRATLYRVAGSRDG